MCFHDVLIIFCSFNVINKSKMAFTVLNIHLSSRNCTKKHTFLNHTLWFKNHQYFIHYHKNAIYSKIISSRKNGKEIIYQVLLYSAEENKFFLKYVFKVLMITVFLKNDVIIRYWSQLKVKNITVSPSNWLA